MESKGTKGGLDAGHPLQREFLALQEIITTMHGTSELKKVLQQVSKAVEVLGYGNSVISLLDKNRKVLKAAAIHVNLGKGVVAKLEAMIGKRFVDFEMPAKRDYSEAARKLLEGKIYVTHSLSDLISPPVNRLVCYAMQQQAKARTVAIIPMPGSEGVIGTILVTTPREEITEADLQVLVNFINQAGIAVERAWLQEEVRREAEKKRKAERRAKQEAAKFGESRAFIESVFNAIADPIVVVNPDKVIIAVNKAMTKLLGYTENELIGHNYIDVYIPLEMRSTYGNRTKQVIAKGIDLVYEGSWQTRSGMEIPVQLHNAPLRDGKGRVIGAIAVARDMRQVKSLVAELEASKERMIHAEKMASIGQVASSVAHELRQPLAVINNSVYFLKMQLPNADKKVKKHLDIMEKEVAIADEIISDLLDAVKLKKLHLAPVKLNSVIEQALSRSQLPQGVEVATELEGVPAIIADSGKLEQVFLNIIANASKAMPDGGQLVITGDVDDNLVIVKVQDNGSGIAEEDLGKVFEPLFTTKAPGVGLGLTISKSIVEAHQGTIEVQSQLGYGTAVTIRLPVS